MRIRHPDQPIITDTQGIQRFKENGIVRFLLDNGPFDLNTLAAIPFTQEDRRQFAQLIGYSVCGFDELPYTGDLKDGE